MKKTHKIFLTRAINVAITHKRDDSITASLEAIRKSKSPVLILIRDIVADPRFYKVTDDSFLWNKFAAASIDNFIDNIEESIWKKPKIIEKLRNEFLTAWMSKNMFGLSTDELKRELLELTSLTKDEINRLAESDYSEKIEQELKESEKEDFGDGVFDCTSGKQPEKNEDIMFESSPFTASSDDLDDDHHQEGKGIGGGFEGMEHYERPISLNSYDKELQRLAMMIGRNGGESVVYRPGKFLRAAKSDIAGITVGNELSAVLPSELALLSSATTENIFYDRYTKKKLQVFASASAVKGKEAKKKMGPIIISVDTSSSMWGEPERMAKSLSLAICEIAQKKRRPVCLVNYSESVSFFILTDINRQRNKLLKFLSLSYGGSNHEDNMFRFIFQTLPQSKKYSSFKDSFENADLLVVSDFAWMTPSNESKEMIENAKTKGMQFYALGIGDFEIFKKDIEFNMSEIERLEIDGGFFGGYGFFNNCDYKFIYDKGRCREMREKKKSRTTPKIRSYGSANET